MIVRENVPLSGLTTLRVGGPARYVIECVTEDDVRDTVAYARERALPFLMLGEGSNVLAPDDGYDGVVILMRIAGISFESDGERTIVTAGAGVRWDELVTACADKGLWGLENLAGIPGTTGAAPVQNIGAYGSEVKDTIVIVRALDTKTNELIEFTNEECAFGYRDSRFKHDPSLSILSVTFSLAANGAPALSYKDLQACADKGDELTTPAQIGNAVRMIRARKFPDLRAYGTAGSFFKNPTVTAAAYEALATRYEGMPGFPNAQGVKIPLAFVLDKVLALRGHRIGNVSLFAEQPLVLVAHDGATAQEIDAFANGIAMRVREATSVMIEREVRDLG